LGEDQHLIEHRAASFDIFCGTGQDYLIAARDKPDLGDEILDLAQVSVRLADEVEQQMVAGYA
jgi:hypothetical protein